MLGGHSKGGNLAVYAAAKASPRTAVRIAAAYDHDGPGFPEGVLAEGELDRVRSLVRKTVPQESLVGLLMESDAGYRVVKSSGRGISQHSPFRWEVEDGAVVEADGLSPSARFTAEVLNEWIAGMDPLERRRAVGALFEALRASGAKDAFDVLMGGPKTIGVLADAARNTRPEARGDHRSDEGVCRHRCKNGRVHARIGQRRTPGRGRGREPQEKGTSAWFLRFSPSACPESPVPLFSLS